MLYHKYKPLAARVYCTGLALLLVLSEVFSSNVQDTLPGFSRIMRLGLTGCAVLLLAGKIILLTGYEARWQKVLIAVVLVYTAFSSWYGGDLWFFLAALSGWGPRMWIGRPLCASISLRRWPGWCWCKRYTLPRR